MSLPIMHSLYIEEKSTSLIAITSIPLPRGTAHVHGSMNGSDASHAIYI